jgi:hypothetical protein
MMSAQRIEALLLALSKDPNVRNSERAINIAGTMQAHLNSPANLEIMALSSASGGDFANGRALLQQAMDMTAGKKVGDQHRKRITQFMQLLENKTLPELDWQEEIDHMMPPPPRARATFRSYPDPNPV